jgi:hypothetical protein
MIARSKKRPGITPAAASSTAAAPPHVQQSTIVETTCEEEGVRAQWSFSFILQLTRKYFYFDVFVFLLPSFLWLSFFSLSLSLSLYLSILSSNTESEVLQPFSRYRLFVFVMATRHFACDRYFVEKNLFLPPWDWRKGNREVVTAYV